VGKVAIGVVAFAAGALVGAWLVKNYFNQHALGLTAQGIADKYLGEGSTTGKVLRDVGDSLQGVG